MACPNRDRHLPDDTAAVIARIVAARAAGRPIVLARREPTLRDDLPALLDAARGDDRRAVGVVSNGRRFAYDDFTAAARAAAASPRSASSCSPPTTPAPTPSPGSTAPRPRPGAAPRALRRAGIAALELRAPLDAGNLAGYAGYAALAGALDVDQLRVEAALDAVSLDALGDGRAVAALDALLAACRAAGVAVEAAPLTAGTSLHHWLPAPRPRRGAGGAATPGRIAP
ncbi:MAG: hypothetical protein H6709_20205 [Kofleriaceae bacterium]|nr:hypothetical protein [Kofleriaceae bacterium]